MIYYFEGGSLDPARRELRRGAHPVAVEPQVFDLLHFLLRHRDRVVSKDDLLAEVWQGRIVSESTLSSRITAVRQAIGDSGQAQRLIRTVARKGVRFVGDVREADAGDPVAAATPSAGTSTDATPCAWPERRQVTIMLCDVEAAAGASEHARDPEALREIAAALYACVKAVAAEHDGYVAHYARGAVLVCFGYPQAHEDDAERAVRAALAAVEAVRTLEGRTPPLRARAAIDTGLVVVGDLFAADAPSDHAVVGDSPAIAARLLETCARDAVVISDATRELVGDLFEYRDTRTAGVCQVLGASRTGNRFAALRRQRAELIGRDEEIDVLRRRWEQAQSGEGRVVLVWGEAGIGKSRLVAALRERIAADHRLLRYDCSPHRMQTALYPVIAEIESAAGFGRGDDDSTKLHKLQDMLRSQAGADMPDDMALVAELLSLAAQDRDTRLALGPQRRKELLLEFAVGRIAALASRKPVMVLLEDAHWIDPTTREWLDILVERVRSLPVLVVVTYRPEFDPAWLGQSHVTVLMLNRLGRRDSAALVNRIAKQRNLPPDLLDRILERTDGVPLFIEEMTKSVLESGIVREQGSALVLADAAPALSIPSTLQASLVARMDRLPSAREVVQTGAALGREFSYATLKAVTALSDSELAPLVDQLVESDLVRQRGAVPNAVYAFKHALVQDAAYGTMLGTRRAQMHRRIAGVLESEFGDESLRHPDVLALHCAEAGLWEKALDYRIRAARMATERSAGVEAQGQVEKGLALLPKVEGGASSRQLEGRLMVALADALVMTRGFASPDVMAALFRARRLLDPALHPAESLRALCGLFNYHLIRSESPQCLALAEPLLDRDADVPTQAVIHYLVGTSCLHLGQFERSIEHLEAALALYDEAACRPVAFVAGYHLRSFTLIWLGLARLYVGAVASAAATVAAAVADARKRSHPFTLVSALLAQARFHSHMHDIAGAIAATDEGLAIATGQRSPYHVSRAGILRAANAIDGGQPEEGIAMLTRALEAHRATGADFQSSYNLSKLAEAHARLGRLDAALELAEQSLGEIERTGERWWEAEALRLHGEILLASARADRGRAEARFTEALACARLQRARLWELRAAQALASLWAAAGRDADARAVLSPVCAAFTDDFAFADLASARETLRGLA